MRERKRTATYVVVRRMRPPRRCAGMDYRKAIHRIVDVIPDGEMMDMLYEIVRTLHRALQYGRETEG